MLLTFKSFINGFRKISDLRNQSELKYILKISLIILITAESALYTNCRNDWNHIL
jgi:hypothetical protein